ncbi:MAG TPA: hypothetical protein VNQ77_20130 [Frankiaceae bacterium]|nr:hypothetical protein [Frankiaceae bacterium]
MKRLTLKSETLSELTADELTGVAGGVLPTLPLDVCLDELLHTNRPTQCLCP